MCSYTTFEVKVDLCAHTDRKKREIYPPSIFRLHFDSYHPPRFPQVDGGGCYREKFFYFFYSRLDSCLDSVFQIILFNYFDSIKVRHLILDFIFQTLHRFWLVTSFARYLLVCDSRIRFWIYTLINFDLFQHCRFYASTLQLFISLTLLLVINKHLCLCEFVLCLF